MTLVCIQYPLLLVCFGISILCAALTVRRPLFAGLASVTGICGILLGLFYGIPLAELLGLVLAVLLALLYARGKGDRV